MPASPWSHQGRVKVSRHFCWSSRLRASEGPGPEASPATAEGSPVKLTVDVTTPSSVAVSGTTEIEGTSEGVVNGLGKQTTAGVVAAVYVTGLSAVGMCTHGRGMAVVAVVELGMLGGASAANVGCGGITWPGNEDNTQAKASPRPAPRSVRASSGKGSLSLTVAIAACGPWWGRDWLGPTARSNRATDGALPGRLRRATEIGAVAPRGGFGRRVTAAK